MKKHLTLEIEKVVYGGLEISRAAGKIVFVPFTAPGEWVAAEVAREKRDYAEAALKRVEQASPLRVNPFCPHFGECGGC